MQDGGWRFEAKCQMMGSEKRARARARNTRTRKTDTDTTMNAKCQSSKLGIAGKPERQTLTGDERVFHRS